MAETETFITRRGDTLTVREFTQDDAIDIAIEWTGVN